MQLIGAVIEFKGKTAPGIMRIKGVYTQRKKEQEAIKRAAAILPRVEETLASIEKHYSQDNITMRDGWMKSVNEGIHENKKQWEETNRLIVSLLIESKRTAIINFASKASDEKSMLTREEFKRIFKTYDEYEDLIEKNGLTNGEVEISIRIIREAYEERLRYGTFLEDMRGYNL